MPGARQPEVVVDLLGCAGTGPLWGMASAELNATLLAWPPGHEVVDDAASELDVLLIVLEGGGTAKVDGQEHSLMPGSALLVDRCRTRAIRPAARVFDTSRCTGAAGCCRSPGCPSGPDSRVLVQPERRPGP